MKRVFNYLAVAASAILVLSACTSDKLEAYSGQPDTNPESPDNAITFGTYTAQSGITRGGAYGAIDNAKLKSSDYGFGVFAYSTGNTDYSSYRTQNGTTDHFPNFMYNQKVTYNSSTNKWEYTPIKYWPNEIQDGAVDDQNNDSANDPATGSGTYGGKLSFFAYAPYANADVSIATGIIGQSTKDYDATTSGITAISGNGFNGGKSDATEENEKYKFSDPYVQYKLSSDNDKQVDLLWGTTTGSSENVINETAQGLTTKSSALPEQDGSGTAITSDRPDYYINTDLTKQKTTGTVNFVFKHALAKIGGSHNGTGDGSDDDASTKTNGLMVVLDLDQNGNETGGSMENYAGTSLESGSIAANNKYNTKVTINEISIVSEKQLTDAGRTAIKTNNTFTYDTNTENLVSSGILNLATGLWSNLETPSPAITRTQKIVPSDGKSAGETSDGNQDAIIAKEIAEPATKPAYTKAGFESIPIGVTTVPKNVYENEVKPFYFIPGTYPILTISIDYTVRTYDKNLHNAYSEVRQKITKRLYILDKIQLNKQYSILMRLGLTSVKFSATVSEWEMDDEQNVSGQTDGTGATVLTADETVEHVYLPINVAELTSVSIATPANLSFAWDDAGYKNLGAATLTYSDGTTHKTNDVDTEGNFITPLITWEYIGTGFEIEKVTTTDATYTKGDLKATWGSKNISTTNNAVKITFKYGNQSAELDGYASQPCGPLQVTSSDSPFNKEAGTYPFITEVVAGNGEGAAQTGWTVFYKKDETTYTTNASEAGCGWITNIVSSGDDYGKITLQANEDSSSRTATIYLKKNDATSSTITITQNGTE